MADEIIEWTFDTMIWGKLALISKGHPANPPVLLVHGFVDTAATFFPLLEKLSDSYYYVGFDFPGHGKSDPFPAGCRVMHSHMLEVIRMVVDHLKWQQFTYLGHSLAFLLGSYYNSIYPGKIVKMINIDPIVNMVWLYYTFHDFAMWTDYYYSFFEDYDKNCTINHRTFKYSEAVALMASNRNLTEEQTLKVISRSLVHVGGDLYRFSSEPRVKKLVGLPLTEEVLFNIVTAMEVPILNIHATEHSSVHPPKAIQFGKDLYEKTKKAWKDATEITLEGGHDIHITNPETCAMHIIRFLNRKNGKSKL